MDTTTRPALQQELRIDVSGMLAGVDEQLESAVTVYLPEDLTGPVSVAFGYPGGGYGRRYFDPRHQALPGPGQAAYHASRGWVFVACDPIGVGESTLVDPAIMDKFALARTNDAVARATLSRLADGSLLPHLRPVDIAATLGIGHSLGGMQLITQQGVHATFDAVAIMGFSAHLTRIPDASKTEIAVENVAIDETSLPLDTVWAGPLVDDPYSWRWAFHYDDVPDEVVDADLGAGFPERTGDTLPPWASKAWPGAAVPSQSEGVVEQEAAQITVPVFVAVGERDVVPSFRDEAAYYSRSRDLTLIEFPQMAHIHNFAPNRERLWSRLHRWADVVLNEGTSSDSTA